MLVSIHSGKTRSGLDFSQDYNGWKSHIEESFIAFLNKIFRESHLLSARYLSADIHPARDVRLARALPGSTSAQAPSDLTAEDQLCDIINTSIAANAAGTAKPCDKSGSDDTNGLSNNAASDIMKQTTKSSKETVSVEGKKKLIEALQDKSSWPTATGLPPSDKDSAEQQNEDHVTNPEAIVISSKPLDIR